MVQIANVTFAKTVCGILEDLSVSIPTESAFSYFPMKFAATGQLTAAAFDLMYYALDPLSSRIEGYADKNVAPPSAPGFED